MENEPAPMSLVCLECGAANAWDAPSCWVCRTPLQGHSAATTAAKPPQPAAAPRLRFNLSTALVAIAALALLLSLLRESPGVAVLLAIIFGPALLFTVSSARSRSAQGRPMSAEEKAAHFSRSVGITVLVLVGLGVTAVVAVVACLAVVCSSMNFH
jgi:hypothetical protein